jgi:hypothetical protein
LHSLVRITKMLSVINMKKKSQCTYSYKRNIEAHSRNNCCRGKAIRITYSDCVFVASVIQHAIAHVQYSHLWPVRLNRIFSYYIIKGAIFEKNIVEHKMCVLIFSITFVWNISHCKKNLARQYHVCTWVFMKSALWDCNGIWRFFVVFRKILEYQIWLNLSSGSQVLFCERTDRQI